MEVEKVEEFDVNKFKGVSPIEPDIEQPKEPVEYVRPAIIEKFITKNPEAQLPDYFKTGKKEDGTNVSDDDAYDFVFNSLKPNEEPDVPLIKELKDIIKKGSDPEEYLRSKYVQQQDPLAGMTDLEIVKEVYISQNKNNNLGMTDEEIDNDIEKLSLLNIKTIVKNVKEQVQKTNEQRKTEHQLMLEKKFEEDFEQEELQNQQIVNKYIEKISSTNKLGGIEFNEADKAQFIRELPHLVKRDKSTGLNQLEALMQGDESFIEITPILWMAYKGKFDEYLSNIKELAKDNVERKLAPNPPIISGGDAKSPNEFNASKFKGQK